MLPNVEMICYQTGFLNTSPLSSSLKKEKRKKKKVRCKKCICVDILPLCLIVYLTTIHNFMHCICVQIIFGVHCIIFSNFLCLLWAKCFGMLTNFNILYLTILNYPVNIKIEIKTTKI